MSESGPTTFADGQVAAGCRVIKLIGRGGMGEVYLAEHLALDRQVALKTMLPQLGGGRHFERFLREARCCARIEHPNVVTIHDAGVVDGIPYLTMQYVPGQNLAELLKSQGGPLPWKYAAKLIRLAARGLEAVHRHGLIHRDIKPSNIMVSADSRVVLMDFGLVREESGSDLTRTDQVVGTPAFMSPEQCRCKTLDARSDVYSLGCTFYALVTDALPFSGSMGDVIIQVATGKQAEPAHLANPRVPQEVARVIAKAMAYAPENRYSSVADFKNALDEILRDRPSAAAVDTVAARSDRVETSVAPRAGVTWRRWSTSRFDQRPGLGRWLLVATAVGAFLLLAAGVCRRDLPRSASREGMVYIEEGDVWLGNERTRLKKLLSTVSPFKDNSVVLAQALNALTDEEISKKHVSAYWMDEYEVTNRQYAEFVRSTGHDPPEHWPNKALPEGLEEHPVVNVAYRDAERYAEWAGKKLPTREQWVRAYRGEWQTLFPWGDAYLPHNTNCDENNFKSPSPVNATPFDKSSFGIYNLVGNVREFIRGDELLAHDEIGLIKGGCFSDHSVSGVSSFELRFRGLQVIQTIDCGFRCVVEE